MRSAVAVMLLCAPAVGRVVVTIVRSITSAIFREENIRAPETHAVADETRPRVSAAAGV